MQQYYPLPLMPDKNGTAAHSSLTLVQYCFPQLQLSRRYSVQQHLHWLVQDIHDTMNTIQVQQCTGAAHTDYYNCSNAQD